ncbi:MAG: ATP-binding cassette domain-containing protein [Candidatus Altiarchaeota archaeon]|nr:ATP-binding cassette domain-containing protein [Candidatus Altiarchaeota archaeon]
MNVIETTDLSKRYDGFTAVKGLNLTVGEGEIFGLLGPNGAGKTTTLMMLATLAKPSSGTASVGGFDVSREPGKVRRSIGIVFQDPSSDDTLTGYENLKLHGWLYDMPDKLLEERIEEALDLVDLKERKDDRVKKYSGGMRRRLELARGLLHRPKVLFLDEPTLGLDPQSRERIWEYIQKLVKKERITVIITTHYMDEADKLCDRLAIIDHGKVVAMDTPDKLKRALGGDIIRLKAAGLDTKALEGLPYVKEIKRADGVVCLTVDDAAGRLQEILGKVGKVNSVEVRSPTLDDVFLHYTGREIREGAPEGGWGERVIHARAGR